jgi:hypothetical protein
MKANVIGADDVMAGRTQQHSAKMLRDASHTWQLSARKTLTIFESQTLISLDSGRLYDPMTNRFFKKVGSAIVEDDKPASQQDRNQIADLLASANLKALMRNHLVLLINASLNATQFLNGSMLRNGQMHVRVPQTQPANQQLPAQQPQAGKQLAAR